MARLDKLAEISFTDFFKELPKNAWVIYESRNKEYASELKQKNRPWLLSETFYDEPSPSALAYGRTRNPKGSKNNYYKHDKYPKFSDTGWIIGDRQSLDLDDADFFQVEKDDEIQNKIKTFYKKKR